MEINEILNVGDIIEAVSLKEVNEKHKFKVSKC